MITNYKLGDSVWLMDNNRPVMGTIDNININSNGVYYNILINGHINRTCHEKDFTTSRLELKELIFS